MTDSTSPEPANDADRPDPSPLQIAVGFFILPLVLVLAGVAVFLVFGVLAHETPDAASYLPDIMGSGINEPWQAAFHLSQQLQYSDDLVGDRDFAQQVVRVLEKSGDSDPRVRRFLTVALGRIGEDVAVPILVQLTDDPDPEVRVNSLWALGSIGDSDIASDLTGRLADDESDVRTMAAYVLGALRNPATATALQVALNDQIPAVRWNSAVALAQLGDPAGLDLLGKMIDREYLASVPGITDQDFATTMLAALSGLQALGSGAYQTQLEGLRESDPDLRVREAARQTLAAVAG